MLKLPYKVVKLEHSKNAIDGKFIGFNSLFTHLTLTNSLQLDAYK